MQTPLSASRRACIQGVAALGVITICSAGMLLRLEPFATWYYAMAWWPFIFILDAIVLWKKGDSLLWRDPKEFFFLVGLSVPVWLFFELYNLVMQNWYYVGSSPSWAARWVGYTVCFATVLPAVFEATEMMGALGIVPEVRVGVLRQGRLLAPCLMGAGLVCMILPILIPDYGFPLVWLGLIFLLDPVNQRWGEPSLLGELESGSITTGMRLLAGGLLCGLAWELFNIQASCKWIYTVPHFEESKLFEMPLAGFLGFPPFALECYVMVQFVKGAIKGIKGPAIRWALVGIVLVGSLGMFRLLDLYTVNSLHPLLEDLRDLAPQEARILEQAGVKRLDLWVLRPGARARESLALELLGATPEVVAKWRTWAAMAALKGMGTGNLRLMLEAGVSRLGDLAKQEPQTLAKKLREIQKEKNWARQPPREAQVRLWVGEAKRVCAGEVEPAWPGCR